MAGIQDVQPLPISTMGQPLVGNTEPAATPSAVAALTDAFRNGSITAADIVKRIQDQPVADAQRKMALQQASETLDPNAIAARQAAVTLAGATAAKGTATLNTAALVAKHMEYGTTIFGADGKPDYDAMAESGNNYQRAERMFAYASKGIQGSWQNFKDPTTGQDKMRLVNGFGEDITSPGPGTKNPTLERYQKVYHDSFSTLNSGPDHSSNTPGSFATPPEEGQAAPSPVVTSADIQPVDSAPAPMATSIPAAAVAPGEARAWLVNAGALDPAAAASISDSDIVGTYESYLAHNPGIPPVPVRPAVVVPTVAPLAAPSHQITITPTAAGGSAVTVEAKPPGPVVNPNLPVIQPPALYAGGGIPAGPAPGTINTPEAIIKNLRDQDAYKTWSQATGEISEAKALAADPSFAGKTPAQQNATNMNHFDLRLGLALSSLTNPKTVEGRSAYKLEDLDLKQPYLNKYVQNVKEVLMGRGKFSPQVRAELVKATQDLAAAKEETARGSVQNAVGLFKRAGQDPKAFLTSDELGLANRAPTTPAAAVPVTQGTPIDLGNGKTVYGWRQ